MHGNPHSLPGLSQCRDRYFHRRLSVLLFQVFPCSIGKGACCLLTQDEEKHSLLCFLSSVLRNFLLSPSPSTLVSPLPSIHKHLQQLLADPNMEIRCLVPDILFSLSLLSISIPLPSLPLPVLLNELFSLLGSEDIRLRSSVCRCTGLLFSELVLLLRVFSIDHSLPPSLFFPKIGVFSHRGDD